MRIKNITTKKQKIKSSKDNIIEKSKNTIPIRVLYKKTGQAPETKIIDNVFKLKKAIVKKNLDIIPYETVYIICTNKKEQDKNKNPNIILDFYSIYGDLVLVDIDKNKREFKGLSQDDIIWYTQDLMNKSSIFNNIKSTKKPSVKNFTEFYEREFERDSNSKFMNYENTVLNSLTTIELALIKLLKGDNKK